MNYYFDFDNTLYETAKLTAKMLDAVANTISSSINLNANEVLEEIKPQFNSTVDNIFSFAEKMSVKYGIDPKLTIDNVNDVINHAKDIVFPDAIRFIEQKRKNGDRLVILTYIAEGNQEYQLQKIMGSGLANYFDQIIVTSKYKFELDLNYKDGIFIDDDPRDLNGLYTKNPIKVIRIRKENNKRSKIDIDNKDIEEYESFDDIKI